MRAQEGNDAERSGDWHSKHEGPRPAPVCDLDAADFKCCKRVVRECNSTAVTDFCMVSHIF